MQEPGTKEILEKLNENAERIADMLEIIARHFDSSAVTQKLWERSGNSQDSKQESEPFDASMFGMIP